MLADRCSLPFSFPFAKKGRRLPYLHQKVPLEGETIHSVSQTCHALGVPLDAGNVTNRDRSWWLLFTERQAILQKYSHLCLFWALDYFQSLNQVFLQEPGMLILIHDLVWANGGTRYVTKVYGDVIKFGCPAKNWWTLKRLCTISEMWDFKRVWGPASDKQTTLLH